jgi:very-short-patch-repair endonuclease
MLRDFLAYAEAGGGRGDEDTLFANAPTTNDPLRSDLAARLRREGLTVHEDFGTANHRIDLVVEDPYHRGRGLLAVETDGLRYAALHSTRDRDRLRPEQLARLGWLHERAWTTDLFRDPAREIARIVTIVKAIQPPVTRASGDGAGASTDETGDAAGQVDPNADTTGAAADGQSSRAGGDGESSGAKPTEAEAAAGASESTKVKTDAATSKRKRRRVFRKGTGAAPEPTSNGADPRKSGAATAEPGKSLGRSSDELDLGWGERPAGSGVGDTWLQEQRPPHYE